MEPRKVKVWFKAPYGLVGNYHISLETAREALERGGFPTKVENDILMYEMELFDYQVEAILGNKSASGFSMSGSVLTEKSDG